LRPGPCYLLVTENFPEHLKRLHKLFRASYAMAFLLSQSKVLLRVSGSLGFPVRLFRLPVFGGRLASLLNAIPRLSSRVSHSRSYWVNNLRPNQRVKLLFALVENKSRRDVELWELVQY